MALVADAAGTPGGPGLGPSGARVHARLQDRQIASGASDILGVMRLLHTADWHLGRTFHGDPLLDAQARAIDTLVDVARDASIDAVVVAGDVYDRALPPVDAVRLADEALARLSELCPVVVISGNHDSVDRLGFAARILERGGVHVRTRVDDVATPIPVADGLLYALPYLEPDLTATALCAPARTHEAVLRAAMDRVRADLAARGPALRPTAVTAHAFVSGADASPSERDLAVGGSACVPAGTFAGIDYVALGHLHAPQTAGPTGRYAGSLVPFSFPEATRPKSCAVVEVLPLGTTCDLVPLPVWRPLASLRGTLEELLRDAALAVHEPAWVHATLTDAVTPRDAMARLRARFPHAVALAFEPVGAAPRPEGSYAARLEGLDDRELVARFVTDVRGVAPTAEEARVLDEAFVAHRTEQVAA